MIRNITIRRGRRLLIADLNLDLTAGSITWIVGDNGDGKSSLLRVLAGRVRPERGTVAHPAAGASRPIAYYHPHMMVPPGTAFREWLRLFSHLVRRTEPNSDLDALLPEHVEGDRPLSDLSTGEAKRILLHQVLASPTPVTILDEPYEHLSGGAKAALTRLLGNRAERSVVVIATNREVPEDRSRQQVLRLDRGD